MIVRRLGECFKNHGEGPNFFKRAFTYENALKIQLKTINLRKMTLFPENEKDAFDEVRQTHLMKYIIGRKCFQEQSSAVVKFLSNLFADARAHLKSHVK